MLPWWSFTILCGICFCQKFNMADELCNAFWLAAISKIFYKTACMLALLLGKDVHENVFVFFVNWKSKMSGDIFMHKIFWNWSSLKPLHHLKGSLAWIFLIWSFANCLVFFYVNQKLKKMIKWGIKKTILGN